MCHDEDAEVFSGIDEIYGNVGLAFEVQSGIMISPTA
jgi:hypothetical protein